MHVVAATFATKLRKQLTHNCVLSIHKGGLALRSAGHRLASAPKELRQPSPGGGSSVSLSMATNVRGSTLYLPWCLGRFGRNGTQDVSGTPRRRSLLLQIIKMEADRWIEAGATGLRALAEQH
jgi:hypothetical protein